MPPDSFPPLPDSPTEPLLAGFDPAALLASTIQVAEGLLRGSHWTPLPWPEVARLLPKYAITADIGHGGMGAVYLGWHPGLHCRVAVKMMSAKIAADDHFIERFNRERETLRKLHDTHVVPVYDAGRTDEGHFFIVMDYAEGLDLGRLLKSGPLPVDRVLAIGGEICAALERAHAAGIIHRDVKPANILLSASGTAMLGDFGLAGESEQQTGAVRALKIDPNNEATSLTLTGAGIGTPKYAAPEQLNGHATPRSDLFSLGATLYHVLTGRVPSREKLEPPSKFLSGIDLALDRLLLSTLALDPAARPASAREMRMELDRICGERERANSAATSRRPMVQRRLGKVALIIVFLVTASLPFAAHRRPHQDSTPAPSPPPIIREAPDPVAPRAAEQEPQSIEAALAGYLWKWTDPPYPSSTVQFHPDNFFQDQWGWRWWITGSKTMHVQFNSRAIDRTGGVEMRFDDEFTKFEGGFGQHYVRGYRLAPVPAAAVTSAGSSTPPPPVLAEGPENDSGFIQLLDPRDTTGWRQCGPGGFTITDGIASSWTPTHPRFREGVFWHSSRRFGNFVLKLEFRVDSLKSNSGVWLRCPDPGDSPTSIWKQATEIEIRGTGTADGRTGAIAYFTPPHVSALRPQEWNKYEITASGRRITVKLNGILVNEADLDPTQAGRRIHWPAKPHRRPRPIPQRPHQGILRIAAQQLFLKTFFFPASQPVAFS